MTTFPASQELSLFEILEDIFDGPRRIQFVPNGVPYIRLGDLEAGEIYYVPSQKIAPSNLDKRFYLQPGDVLVSKTGDEPRAVVTSEETNGALIAPDIYCLRVKSMLFSPIWLSYFLNTNYGKKILYEHSTVTTLRRINISSLKYLPLVLPPPNLIQEIENLELQAQEQTRVAHEMWSSIRIGVFNEIQEQCKFNIFNLNSDIQNLFSSNISKKHFISLGKIATIAVSSRKLLKDDQFVKYVQTSDIDPYSFLFRRIRSALAKDLPNRIRLPLHTFQVLLLASGSNLGSETHPVAVVDEQLEGGFASNAFIAIDFFETPIYYAMALKHPIVLAQLQKMATGNVIKTIRKKDIVDLQIPQLGSIWRQDFNNKAQLVWEKRSLALSLKRTALEKAESFLDKFDQGKRL